jgi:hypothetical protein
VDRLHRSRAVPRRAVLHRAGGLRLRLARRRRVRRRGVPRLRPAIARRALPSPCSRPSSASPPSLACDVADTHVRGSRRAQESILYPASRGRSAATVRALCQREPRATRRTTVSVRPSLPRPAESASFPTLFRSILVAAFAAEGCIDDVTAAPDAATPTSLRPTRPCSMRLRDVNWPGPDAGPPLENACPAEQTRYYAPDQLDGLRSAGRFDYIEWRTFSRASWDGGLGGAAMWTTAATSGAHCATATSAAACESAFAALANEPAPATNRRLAPQIYARRRGRRDPRRRRLRPPCLRPSTRSARRRSSRRTATD